MDLKLDRSDCNGLPITITVDGFRIYTQEIPIRIGDVVRFRSDEERCYRFNPFGTMVVSGITKDKMETKYTLSRPHCSIWALVDNEYDAQCAVQFERLTIGEESFRKNVVAFVTGDSCEIRNCNYARIP